MTRSTRCRRGLSPVLGGILFLLLSSNAVLGAATSQPTGAEPAPAAAECQAVVGPVFDRPAPDSGPDWWLPVARDSVTIGDLAVPTSQFSRAELGVLQAYADLEICVWATVEDVAGTPTITDLSQVAESIMGHATVDENHPAVADLAVDNGPRDTYLVSEVLGAPDQTGIERDQWPDKLELAWFTSADTVHGSFDIAIDGAPGSASVTSAVRADARIWIAAITATSITFGDAQAPEPRSITLAIPAGSHVDERLVAGGEGCVWFVAQRDGTLWLASQDMGETWCGEGFAALPDPSTEPSGAPAPTDATGAPGPTVPPTDSGLPRADVGSPSRAPVGLLAAIVVAVLVVAAVAARRRGRRDDHRMDGTVSRKS